MLSLVFLDKALSVMQAFGLGLVVVGVISIAWLSEGREIALTHKA